MTVREYCNVVLNLKSVALLRMAADRTRETTNEDMRYANK